MAASVESTGFSFGLGPSVIFGAVTASDRSAGGAAVVWASAEEVKTSQLATTDAGTKRVGRERMRCAGLPQRLSLHKRVSATRKHFRNVLEPIRKAFCEPLRLRGRRGGRGARGHGSAMQDDSCARLLGQDAVECAEG